MWGESPQPKQNESVALKSYREVVARISEVANGDLDDKVKVGIIIRLLTKFQKDQEKQGG